MFKFNNKNHVMLNMFKVMNKNTRNTFIYFILTAQKMKFFIKNSFSKCWNLEVHGYPSKKNLFG